MNEKIILSCVADTEHKVEKFSKSHINIEITKHIKINKTLQTLQCSACSAAVGKLEHHRVCMSPGQSALLSKCAPGHTGLHSKFQTTSGYHTLSQKEETNRRHLNNLYISHCITNRSEHY